MRRVLLVVFSATELGNCYVNTGSRCPQVAKSGANRTVLYRTRWYRRDLAGTSSYAGKCYQMAVAHHLTPSISYKLICSAKTTTGVVFPTRTALLQLVNPALCTAGTPGQMRGTVDIQPLQQNTINWYTAATGGTPIANTASGATFTTLLFRRRLRICTGLNFWWLPSSTRTL
jgi:hypothetical protein